MASRIALKPLSEVCRRTAVSHAAGLDARSIWKREAENGGATKRRQFKKVSEAIDNGATLADALNETDLYLPQLVRDMVHVGEESGKIDEALNRLGEYYEHMRNVQRAFFAGIAWPMIQFMMAVLLVGFVIWVAGYFQSRGVDLDMVGFGLSGTSGALIYFAVVGVMFVGIFLFFRSLIHGRLSAIVMTPLMKLPVVGPWLQLMAMSRMTWALGMSVESGMAAKKCADIALRSTQNRYYIQHSKAIKQSIGRGETLFDAFNATGAFREDFLDSVSVGEESGRLGESMTTLSRQYEQQGKVAMQALALAAGVGVWITVAAIIIFFIFRFAMFYVGLIQGVIDGTI
jgi:type II secretory pathway component PulF